MNYPTELQQKMDAGSMRSGGSLIGSGTAPQSDAFQSARPSTEIEDCLNRAENALSRLVHRVEVMEERLRPVMRMTGVDAKNKQPTAPHEVLSGMGEAIRLIENKVDGACERLEVILSNLAL